jgi:hypothetical protein|tara:strand:+ start:1628 stop:2893 length:1266 start_codon:yes stop_codon:yes gene_type:complete
MLASDLETRVKPELLALMLQRTFWRTYQAKILENMFPSPVDKVYTVIKEYHVSSDDDLDPNKLWELIKIRWPTMTDAKKLDVKEIVDDIRVLPPWTEEFAVRLLTEVWKKEVFRQLVEQGVRGSQGLLDDLESVRAIVADHGEGFVPRNQFAENNMGIDELMEHSKDQKSWDFIPAPLARRLGPAHGGHFVMLMARPDCGKTAWLISQVCGPGGWAEQGATVDWYMNEEPIERTRWRCLSANSGLTKEQMLAEPAKVREQWAKVEKGVRTIEIPAGTSVEHIRLRTEERKPDVLIIDQLDKLSVRSPTSGGFKSDTDRIRELYIQYREIAKATGALVLGVCQASNSAEGKRMVTYDMAENSKTGKASECDVFLAIGKNPIAEDVVVQDWTRFITVSKNKLDSGFKGMVSCKLKPEVSRYVL